MLKVAIAILVMLSFTILQSCKKTESSNFIFNDESGGCANFIVYKYAVDSKSAISVEGNTEALEIGTKEKTYDIGKTPKSDLKVLIREFESEASSYFCDDVAGDPAVTSSWEAESGKVKIKIDGFHYTPQFEMYDVTVILQNVVLKQAGTGKKIEIKEIVFSKVLVGWKAG